MAERPSVVRTWPWWLGFVAVVAWALVMTERAYREGLPTIFERPYVDKLAHFVTAGLLAFFLDGALRRRMLFASRPFAVPLAAALVLVPTGVEEYIQRYATFRTASFGDYAADITGVVLLVTLSRRVARRAPPAQ